MDEKGFVKTNDDGLYSISKRGSDLAYAIVNSTILMPARKWTYRDMDNDYNSYKEYQEFEGEVDNMFHASTSIASLPSEISWDNFKLNGFTYVIVALDVQRVAKCTLSNG